MPAVSMRAVLMRGSSACLLVIALCCAAACDRPQRYSGRGIVEDLRPEWQQVVVDHEEIPGLMDAMTMNFTVHDEDILAQLAPGKKIEFVVEAGPRGYRIVEAKVVGEVEPDGTWVRLGDLLVKSDPAPDFELIDHTQAPFSLSRVAGKAVLLDFIFTTCPGPCPILTSTHVSTQRKLSPELRDRIHFVSISLDPVNDTPDKMAEYGRVRGADLERWTFVTGPEEQVAKVIMQYGVGSTRAEDGTIEHLVVSFLIDGQGRIVKRYMGLEHEPEALARDLEALAAASAS
jgi:protein SCO1/2